MTSGWGFSDETSSTASWGFGTDAPGSSATLHSELEAEIVSSRNRARRVMSTVPELTAHLAQAGLDGPRNIVLPGLDKSPWATKIGLGAQFTVFLDTRRPDQDQVIKRVNVFDTYSDREREQDANFRKQLYTIETEILALCHPPLRKHRNIVTLFYWGYDYRDDTNSPAVPVLYLERALCSLSSFLTTDSFRSSIVPQDIIGYQLCLDAAEGLAAMHRFAIVHGDIKPDNILIFPHEDPKVPFIARLSDFGVCVALQDSLPTDFTVYRGTPGWRPPEAARYVEEVHGRFTPELLFRSDSFSYGLLVLSVLVTGGKPPLGRSLEDGGELLSSVSNAVSVVTPGLQSPLDDALEVLGRATLRGSLKAQVRSLLPLVLGVRPEDRALVGSEMLADSEEDGYLDWLRQRDSQSRLPPKHTFKDQSLQQGQKYWLEWGPSLLRGLDKQYEDLMKLDGNPGFPGETLHGMAVTHLASKSRRASYRANVDRALMYMTAAALGGFYVAQGVCERLHKGLGRELPESVDGATRLQWLYNAAKTGSLLAGEVLMGVDRELWVSTCSEFRGNGGYNSEYARTIKTQVGLLEESRLADIMEKHDINDYIIDVRGNRLLHLSAMVGNIKATQTLLSLSTTDVNARNDTNQTPLLLACKAGHARVVELLVDNGADASILPDDPFSVSPLHWLFTFPSDEIPDTGRMLLKANAQLNHRTTPRKIKALYGGGWEYPYGQIQAWHFPFEWPYGTALHWAVFAGCREAVDALCGMGADVDAVDLDGEFAMTPLCLAANCADVGVVELLLRRGASPCKTDGKGRGPLHFLSEDVASLRRESAGWRGMRDWVLCGTSGEHRVKVDGVVRLLLEAGCDIEGTMIWGKDFPLTPLGYATGRKTTMDANVTLSLVESGAKIDVPLPTERSLLQEWAVVNPGDLVYPDVYTTVLTTLIEKSGVGVLEHRDPLGYTFLGDLMGNGWLSVETLCQVVECYRAAGGPLEGLNSQDKNGYTALHGALRRYQSKFKNAPLVQLVEALWKWGTDLTVVSHDHLNALHILGQNDWLDDLPALHCLQLFKEKIPTEQFVRMVGQRDSYGHTPLMFMAKSAKPECVRFLVEEGVNTDALCATWSQQDWTALDFALNEAERYRRWFLVEVHAYEALRDGVHNYTLKAQSRSDDLKDNFPKTFKYLRSKGAKRGSELGLPTGGHYEPLGFDQFALGEYKMDAQTPEEWKFVYELESRPPKESPTLLKSLLGVFLGK